MRIQSLQLVLCILASCVVGESQGSIYEAFSGLSHVLMGTPGYKFFSELFDGDLQETSGNISTQDPKDARDGMYLGYKQAFGEFSGYLGTLVEHASSAPLKIARYQSTSDDEDIAPSVHNEPLQALLDFIGQNADPAAARDPIKVDELTIEEELHYLSKIHQIAMYVNENNELLADQFGFAGVSARVDGLKLLCRVTVNDKVPSNSMFFLKKTSNLSVMNGNVMITTGSTSEVEIPVLVGMSKQSLAAAIENNTPVTLPTLKSVSAVGCSYGNGKQVNATKTVYFQRDTEITKEQYDEIMLMPDPYGNYAELVHAGDPSVTLENAHQEADYFMNTTWVDPTEWATSFSAEEQAVMSASTTPAATAAELVAARATATHTTTSKNYNPGSLGSDQDWVARYLRYIASTTTKTEELIREICVCPYDRYGELCQAYVNLRCDVTGDSMQLTNMVSAPFSQISACKYQQTVLPGSQWNDFDNLYDPRLAGSAPCFAGNPYDPTPLSLSASVNCRFQGPVYQGVRPEYIKAMRLEGYSWPTDYGFEYAVFRPVDTDPANGRDHRDESGSVPPTLAISTGSTRPFFDGAFSLVTYPVSFSRSGSSDKVGYTKIPATVLEQVTPVPLTVPVAPLSQLHSAYMPGGRAHFRATVLQNWVNRVSGGKLSWIVENADFQPTPRKPASVSSYVLWLIGAVCVVIALLIIVTIKCIYDKKQQKKLEMQGKNTQLNSDI